MVSTRSGSTKPVGRVERDDNRIIVVVTGANSGFGLGICQQLLFNLSLPPGTPMPASVPQSTALPPSLQYLLHSNADSALSSASFSSPSDQDSQGQATKSVPSDPPTLTLILACRSQSKAEEARHNLLEQHFKDLRKRESEGEKETGGWKDGLRIVWEGVDMDSLGGKNGVLTFCERLKDRYPHITTLCLNAGMGAWSGLNYWEFTKQIVIEGMPEAMSQPRYQLEMKGAMSSDGERGLVWGTNVLAPYIMARELVPLLRRSPSRLPFSPRILYTSSLTSHFDKLTIVDGRLDDYQLLEYPATYSASKYMGDLVMCQLDREFSNTSPDVKPDNRSSSTLLADGAEEGDEGKQREVRVLTVDPGCVTTNFFNAGLGAGVWAWWATVKWLGYWLSFYICRLLGSPHHPVYADQGALPIIYGALIPSQYIPSALQVPAPRFGVIAERWGRTKVSYGEVDRWEEGDKFGKEIVERCESVRKEWRRREGLD